MIRSSYCASKLWYVCIKQYVYVSGKSNVKLFFFKTVHNEICSAYRKYTSTAILWTVIVCVQYLNAYICIRIHQDV